jgi:excisionase family DNA binding protein
MSKKAIPFLSVAQAATKMGISERWVRELIATGVIEGDKLDDGPWLIPRTEVKRFLSLDVPAQGAHRVRSPA